MAKSALKIAKAYLAEAEENRTSMDDELCSQRAAAAAQVAIAEELNRIASALWILVEQKPKK